MYFITTKRMLEVCFFQHTPTFIIEPIKINLSNCTNCTFHVVTFTQLIGASRHWDLLLCTIFLI